MDINGKQQRIVDLLSLSRLGLSSRDIARKTGLRASDANKCLLDLQSQGLVETRRNGEAKLRCRWEAGALQRLKVSAKKDQDFNRLTPLEFLYRQPIVQNAH